MSADDIHHATFVIERRFAIPAERTFRFFSEPELKAQWTACHPDWRVVEDVFDFRAGGVEAKRWRLPDGSEQTFTAHYLDIAAPRRIVYAFEMSMRGERISASLATVALQPDAGATRMKYTEQIAFFGSRAALDQRIAGTDGGFGRLVALAGSPGLS